MDKNIGAVFLLNEPETLRIIKPFDCSLSHFLTPLFPLGCVVDRYWSVRIVERNCNKLF
jgi:hypothetical protein